MNKHLTATIDATRADEEARTVSVSISSETPVPRPGFIEVLDHSPGAVDLSRSPLPVLVQHNRHEINVGIIENIKLVGRKLRGLLRLGESDVASELWTDIQGGIIRNLSVGYEFDWDNVTENDGVARVMLWQPVEVSIVSVPADSSIGINRNLETNMSQTNENLESLTRSQKKAEQREKGVISERERVSGLLSLGRSTDNMLLAERFVKNGRSVQDLQDCVDVVKSQAPSIPSQKYVDLNSWSAEHNRGEGHSLFRAIASQIQGTNIESGYEKEVSQEITRSLGKNPQGIYVPIGTGQRAAISKSGDGGNLIGTMQMGGEFIDVFRNKSIITQLGAYVLNNNRGDISIPRKLTTANSFWVSDGVDVGESTPTFDNLSMSPKTVGVFSDLTRKMILQSDPDAQQMLTNDLAETIATEVDRVAISGDGLGSQPVGIRNTSGVGLVSLGANGGAPDWSTMIDLVGKVSGANADNQMMAFATNTNIRSALLKSEKFAGGGESVWSPGTEGNGSIAGFRALVSNHIPSDLTKGTGTNLSSIVFGNWSELILAHWNALDILVDPYTMGLSGGIRIRVMMDIDISIRHPQSFAIIEDAIA